MDDASALAPKLSAPQHRPRPLPLFLDLLRSETAGDSDQLKRALAGLRRYQEFPRDDPPEPMPAVADSDGAAVRDYGGTGPPVLFVPSLINPPGVLDLSREKSLLRWLAGRGHHVLLLDWGWPDARRSGLSVTAHVEDVLLPLIEALGEPAVLVGYCLGGTMALGAARAAAAPAVATLAAPWHFSGFPDEARAKIAALWESSRSTADALGLLPMEVLQSAFWSLDPARTVAKFEAFADAEGARAEAFVTLEDWANDGPPLAAAAARELFEDFFAEDRTGRGEWQVAGGIADPGALSCPVLEIVSTVDRIVPAGTAAAAGERLELDLGHVGMVVGSRAGEALWEPLDRWLLQARPSC
ncbi:MAG TPA: alpha/beta fold hydrolase [Allosphingosinicella sp.]